MARNNLPDIYAQTFSYGVRIVKLIDRLPRSVAAIEIGRQLLRSGTSVGANLCEAGNAESTKDFVHKISIARKEAQESHYWLELLNSTVLKQDTEAIALIDESAQIARILYAISHPKSKS